MDSDAEHWTKRDTRFCAGRIMNPCTVFAGLVGISLLSGCSAPVESEPISIRSQAKAGERPRDAAEDKAWHEASRIGTAPAIAAYLQQYGSGAHAAEARQRLSALEERAQKEEEQEAWAKTFRAGSVAAI